MTTPSSASIVPQPSQRPATSTDVVGAPVVQPATASPRKVTAVSSTPPLPHSSHERHNHAVVKDGKIEIQVFDGNGQLVDTIPEESLAKMHADQMQVTLLDTTA